MTELDLKLGDLNLRLILVRHEVEEPAQSYRDWFRCDVLVAVPSFSGRFLWSVMPGELLDLARNLQALYDQFPNRGPSVSFAL